MSEKKIDKGLEEANSLQKTANGLYAAATTVKLGAGAGAITMMIATAIPYAWITFAPAMALGFLLSGWASDHKKMADKLRYGQQELPLPVPPQPSKLKPDF